MLQKYVFNLLLNFPIEGVYNAVFQSQ